MRSKDTDGSDRRALVTHAVGHVAHFLPNQGPLGVFVHHNTLHAFQHFEFHEAIAAASAQTGAEAYLPEDEYRQHIRTGRIREEDLDAVLAEDGSSDERTLFGGRLSRRGVRRIALEVPVRSETMAGVGFLIDEADLATRLPETVVREHATRIVEEGARVVRRTALEGDLSALGALLLDEADPRRADDLSRRRFGARLRPADVIDALSKNGEPFAVSALFSGCTELVRRELGGRSRTDGRSSLAPDPRGPLDLGRHRDLLLAHTQVDIDDLVNPILIAMAAAYLDDGLAYWPMPSREEGFFGTIRALFSEGPDSPAPWLRGLTREMSASRDRGLDATDTILDVLHELGIGDDELEEHVACCARALPGWAGMFSRLERHPLDRLPGAPPASLVDFLAVRFVLVRRAIAHVARTALDFEGALDGLRDVLRTDAPMLDTAERLCSDAQRLFVVCAHAGISRSSLYEAGAADAAAVLDDLDAFDSHARRRLLHEAYERRHRRQVASALRQVGPVSLDHAARMGTTRVQMVSCLDERSESIRRHIEEIGGEIETLGAAGFFELAIRFKSLDDVRPIAQCPINVTPTHVVEERAMLEDWREGATRQMRKGALTRVDRGTSVVSQTLLRGTLFTLLFGGLFSIPLVGRVFFPRLSSQLARAISSTALPAPRTELTALARAAPTNDGEVVLGLAASEAADRIAALLESIGVSHRLARLVVIVGHGSSSQNNPHLSAYACGACGGRAGGPNARLFAELANAPAVRHALAERGIAIPDDTVFIGGQQDTCSEELRLFDLDRVPSTHADDVAFVEGIVRRARALDAHERCRRFLSAPRITSPEAALRHVEARSESLAEPRPEYGHSGNAVCIVGRRALTRGLFLDRRAFLVSYDPTTDPDGAGLARTLVGIGPVVAGINLEYYFSRVDNERYGCGTKLPHNIVGLLGVMNGHSSDLRTGLSAQMVEIQEPVRLVTVIETTPEMLEVVLEREEESELAELVRGRWIQVVTMDPTTGEQHELRPSGFVRIDGPLEELATARSSREWYEGHAEHLPPARIVPKQPSHDR